MSEKAIENLEKEITEVENEIIKNKVDIADLFVKVHNRKPILKSDFDDLMDRIQEMDKMPPLVEKLEKNEIRLKALLDSKCIVEKSQTEAVI